MKQDSLHPRVEIMTVDDHPMTRLALKLVIEQRPGWEVIKGADNPSQFLAMLGEHEPKIVVTDLMFEDASGLDLLRHLKIHHPRIRTVVYSMRSDEHYAERCLRAGARAYVRKDEPVRVILEAIDRVLAGGVFLSGRAAAAVAQTAVDGQTRPAFREEAIASLSNRELEVFDLIGQGWDTRRISEHLHRSVKTIETYRYRIKKKLGLDTAVELAQLAFLHREGAAVGAGHDQ